MTTFRMAHRAQVAAGAEDRSVTVTCSTETLGRDEIILISSGIELDRYRQNPVWLWQHNPDWPIARATTIDVIDGKLVARVTFPAEGVSERADEIYGLVRAGVINAASTGFETIEAEPIDPKRPDGGIRITRCELQEVSFVSIPAVPDALVTERALEEVRRMVRKARATEDWKCGASRDLAIDASDEWDGQVAEDSIFNWAGGDDFDPEKAKQGFLIYNSAEPKLRGSYKLPFARAVEGELKAVSEGLRAAASRLDQTDATRVTLDEARNVIDMYDQKAGIGEEERARRIAVVRGVLKKRGLYEVANLAYLLEELGWVHNCAEFEADIENDESKVPAMIGEGLKQIGAALVAMTTEEVQELLTRVDVEVEPVSEVDGEDRSVPARFKRMLNRTRTAMKGARPRPSRVVERRTMATHRRMAQLYERELSAN
ncbi:MAG: HK97 family phage prohead protease [Betaproteobacteria bacterium]|nr:HK97 family phage prohead protease [Betaproteobacteria bacterium]